MELLHNIEEVRNRVRSWKKDGFSVGLVPTMGYLHEGHQSLIKKAVEENDKVVVSIFVNPMQFGENEDLETYPRDINKDSKLCDETGADLIFNPEPEEMYKEGFCSYVDMNGLTTELCGKSRPIHFRGVMTVVTKLFNIVTPDRAYFGMKDAQQLCVIKRIVKDLNMDIDVIGCPIIREEDGLAKSSRNTYLNKEERKAALILYKTISLGKDLLVSGERDVNTIINKMKDNINKEPLAKIDYVEAVDLETVEKIDVIKGKVLIAMAVYIGKTRLIDNFTFEC
ncbi:pantoate--beta-alanine ligase [Anaerofustis stercorihominis]|uniref:pantoate--beta-alanine ligase n=1 Tax=Anaerofustis stercorihominis TaxID=214853 RepID=UPI00214AB75D|nr:pantoate--beta-alanine ligase [Anaerofustis stercorihominis]MCR2032512.1 pantoate--beta-alanine ligase [Anaerofustis stercorihominis]